MGSSLDTSAPPLAAAASPADPPALREQLFADLSADPAHVRSAIDGFAGDDLETLGIGPIEAAFLLAFGKRWPRAHIRREAERAARAWIWGGWEWRAYAERLAAGHEGAGAVLSGWGDVPLPARDESPRGAVVVTFHTGAFRFLISDLALLGRDVVMPIDAMAYSRAQAGLTGVDTPALRRLQLVNADEPGVTARLADALRQGRLALICADGNAGPAGRHGTGGEFRTRFLGQEIHAKTGAARLAAAAGVELMVLFGEREEGTATGRVRHALTIAPPQSGDEASTRAFAREAMEAVWRAYEQQVVARPEEWEGARLFPLWRTPSEAIANPAHARGVIEAYRRGDRLVMARGWVIASRDGGRMRWTDVRTGRGLTIPVAAEPMASTLSGGGLTEVEHRRLDPDGTNREASERYLEALATRELVTTVDDAVVERLP